MFVSWALQCVNPYKVLLTSLHDCSPGNPVFTKREVLAQLFLKHGREQVQMNKWSLMVKVTLQRIKRAGAFQLTSGSEIVSNNKNIGRTSGCCPWFQTMQQLAFAALCI